MKAHKHGAFALLLALAGPAAEAKDEWIEVRSEHFTLLTDAGKGRARDILYDLEQLRRLITEALPAHPVESYVPATLYAFKNDKSFRDFQPLRDGKPERWAAMFRPMGFKNFILFDASGSKDGVRELAFQQYLHLMLSYTAVDYPVWLENGLSLFYANAYISEKHAEIGKMHAGHRRALGEFRSMPIEALFAVDRSSREYREAGGRELFDAQSWALVHYLLVGRNPEGTRQLNRYLDFLGEGRNEILAFQEATGTPLAAMDSEVSGYIRKRLSQYFKLELPPLDIDRKFTVTELSPPLEDARLGELLIAVRRFGEARSRLEAAVEADASLTEAYEGLAFLHGIEGSEADSLAFLGKAVAAGSSNPMVHFHYARTLLDEYQGTVQTLPEETRSRATAALLATLQAAPSHLEAASLFGFVSLFEGGDVEKGIAVVTEALKSHRGHPRLLFMLGQLCAQGGSYADARMIYENLLKRKLDPEMVANVRRHLDWILARSPP